MPIRRTLKNVVKNYSDAQVKVREATSNDPWGPSSTLMSEIADLTYNVVAFTEIMQMVWKRLNDHGKNWRHVYKSLVLLDYIIKTGSEKVAQQCKENIFAIQTLKDFQYIEDGKDHGINVREKAKQMVQLLKDDDRLKNERAKALKAKERFAQTTMGIGSSGQVIKYPTGGGESPTLHSGAGGYSDPYGGATGQQDFQASSPGTDVPAVTRPAIEASEPIAEGNVELEAARPSTAGEEELQLQLALAMSKEEHDEEVKRQKVDTAKLQMAIEESRKEQQTEGPPPNTLLDLAIGSSASVPSTLPSDITDPWGEPINEQPPPTNVWSGSTTVTPNPPSIDPWNPTNSIQKPEVAPSNDIWGASGGLDLPPPKADPWRVEPSSTASSQSSPWGSPTNKTSHTNGAVSSAGPPPGIDDEFDMLSSMRSKSPNTTDANTSDLLGGGGTAGSQNTWDLSGMRSGLTEPYQGQGVPKKKSPGDFLGANSDLVNLDNLIGQPNNVPGSTNPFAGGGGGSESVFGSSDNQAPRMPMNQMQSTSVTMGFQQSSSTVLPAPLLPLSTTSQSQFAPMQAQSNNPFL